MARGDGMFKIALPFGCNYFGGVAPVMKAIRSYRSRFPPAGLCIKASRVERRVEVIWLPHVGASLLPKGVPQGRESV